ncbi:MAG TPA: hypothetical protein VK611_17070 [Acidimicrobiales bacterium]|nr:hypothetical protein [Acidimicrobiales bacterium]
MATARPLRRHKVATHLDDAELAALDAAVARQHTTRSDLARRLVLDGIEECCDLFDAERSPDLARQLHAARVRGGAP